MWTEGSIKVQGRIVFYWIKSFTQGSIYGIDQGRISKLMLKRDDVIIASYDRGWDIEPIDSNAKVALEVFIKEYN
jgi:hypothetical protein